MKIQGITVDNNIDNTTHQQFVDDTILLGVNSREEAKKIEIIINNYTKASGQKINPEKSKIFFLNTPIEEENFIFHYLGYKKGTFPCKCLSILLEKGSKQNKGWENILE